MLPCWYKLHITKDTLNTHWHQIIAFCQRVLVPKNFTSMYVHIPCLWMFYIILVSPFSLRLTSSRSSTSIECRAYRKSRTHPASDLLFICIADVITYRFQHTMVGPESSANTPRCISISIWFGSTEQCIEWDLWTDVAVGSIQKCSYYALPKAPIATAHIVLLLSQNLMNHVETAITPSQLLQHIIYCVAPLGIIQWMA